MAPARTACFVFQSDPWQEIRPVAVAARIERQMPKIRHQAVSHNEHPHSFRDLSHPGEKILMTPFLLESR
jgi:hypothetical protein